MELIRWKTKRWERSEIFEVEESQEVWLRLAFWRRRLAAASPEVYKAQARADIG